MLLRSNLLSGDEARLVARMERSLIHQHKASETANSYYDGLQRLKHMGMAAPDELLRSFETVVNVPRMAVDEPVRRQQLRSFQRSGSAQADPALREAWEANNLDSQAPLCHKDARIFGRTFVSVSTNDEDADHPLVTVEDPTQFSCVVDNRRRRMLGALRKWKQTDDGGEGLDSAGTLYLPDRTIWMQHEPGRGWVVEDVDEHGLGRVPVVMFLNRPRAGNWVGVSEMADVMKLTDGIARLITNMLVASETHAVPDKWVAGVSKGDFVDKDGKPLPTWETYFAAIKATANDKARFGQFSASDLRNFHDSVNNMLAWCASVLGLPTRYAGQQSVNPAAEGAIRADESRLIKNVEMMNALDGDSWAWVMALYERFRTNEWVPGTSIRAIWEDPATPTRAERADAITKFYAQGLLSREGAWDEMGWDEARKDRERAYFAAEAEDPFLAGLMREVRGAGTGSGSGAVPIGAAPVPAGADGAAAGSRIVVP